MGRLVIGLGTGRCGTQSLAALLDAQAGVRMTHERFYKDLHWQGAERKVESLIEEAAASGRIEGDVASSYLPYVEHILSRSPDTRFVCLERDREGTVASFMAKTRDKADHWKSPAAFTRHAGWNRCFPDYDHRLTREQAIGRYWDDYHRRAKSLAAAYPDNVILLPMEALNTESGQREILEFVGIPRAEQCVFAEGVKLNRG